MLQIILLRPFDLASAELIQQYGGKKQAGGAYSEQYVFHIISPPAMPVHPLAHYGGLHGLLAGSHHCK